MSRDPFLRLALIAAATVYVIALAAVWRWLGPAAAIAGGIIGIAGGAALTLEFDGSATARTGRSGLRRADPEVAG